MAGVADQPAAVPLLSFVLSELFERRRDRALTVASCRELGGVSGAIARRAEQLYAQLDRSDQDLVPRLFGRLVAVGIEHDDARRRVLRSELVASAADPAGMERLVDTWGAARLLTFDRDAASRAPTVELAPVERDFLGASRAERDRQEQSERDRHRRQVRTNRRLRTLLVAAATALVVAIAATLVAVGQRQEARDEAARADAQARAATLGLAAASASALENDRARALLLAIEARNLDDSPATRRALLRALTDPTPSARAIRGPEGADAYRAMAITPDGRIAVAKREAGPLDVVDLDSREPLAEALPAPSLPAIGVDIDRNGSLVVASGFAGDDGVLVVVYDFASGQRVHTVEAEPGTSTSVRFSPAGDVLTYSESGSVHLLRTSDWTPITRLDSGIDAPFVCLDFSRDGSVLVAGTEAGEMVVWDVGRAELLHPPTVAHDGVIVRAVFPAGGDVVVTAGSDGTVRRWALDSLEPLGAPLDAGDIVWDLALAPDDRLIAAATTVGIVLVDAATGNRASPIDSIPGGAYGVSFRPDGTLVAAGPDDSMSIWRYDGSPLIGDPLDPAGPGVPTLSPDGRMLAFWGSGAASSCSVATAAGTWARCRSSPTPTSGALSSPTTARAC